MDQQALLIVASVRAALFEQESELEQLQGEAAALRTQSASSARELAAQQAELSMTCEAAARLQLEAASRRASEDLRSELRDRRAALTV